MVTLDMVREQRDRIAEAAARHGASNVRVFGSVARGEARPESDLDVLIDLEPDRSLLDHAALALELQALLDCKVDVAVERGLRPVVRERVLGEAVRL